MPKIKGDVLLRSEFEENPIWAVLDAVDKRLDTIAGDEQLNEIAPSELLRVLVTHVRSFRALSTTSPLLFTTAMLGGVQGFFDMVVSSLDTRIQQGIGGFTYLTDAVANAEGSLPALAPWPRPYAKGAQIQATTTMYEELLEAQRKSVEVLEATHKRLREQVAELSTSTAAEHAAVSAQLTTILAEAQAAVATVDAEKARIDKVVSDGLASIAALEKDNTERYKSWQDERAESFTQDFQGLRSAIEADRDTAAAALAKLVETNRQYENLTTLAAGDLIAGAFQREARWGRVAGLIAYGIGFAFLGLGSIPLLMLLAHSPDTANGAPDWGSIVVRVSIAVLAGSAATVVITLGARFVKNANLSKRMDLELRSFGPFLANVRDTDPVDAARIELLDRAFGNAYGEADTDSKEEVVQVSTLMQLINGASKLFK
ncbi:MAG: hypothetical protein JWM49_2119 [Microbacteriaceae bacterium]|nr:hypothetical protein [Microbacteriaceae bacterium]